MSALVQEPDGKLIAVGSGTIVGRGLNIKSAYFALVRYNPDGSLDTNFGRGGKVTTAMGRLSAASALVRQPDGRLVVGEQAGEEQFVTGLVVRIDLAAATAGIVNAGHPPPFRVRAGRVEQIQLQVDQPFGMTRGGGHRVQALPLRWVTG